MKALLYKDLCVLWKQMKFVIVMVAVFCLMPDTGFSLNTIFVAYAGLIIPVTLFAYDERAKWDALAAMLPYSIRDLVLSRYFFGWAATGFAALCYLLGQFLTAPGHVPTKDSLLSLVLLLALVLVTQAVYFPVLFRLGSEKGRLSMTAILIGMMIVITIVIYILKDIPFFPQLLAPLGLAAAALLCLGSVKVSMGQYEKRKW